MASIPTFKEISNDFFDKVSYVISTSSPSNFTVVKEGLMNALEEAYQLGRNAER